MYPFEPCFSLVIYPGVGFQGHMVALFLVFQRISILFSIIVEPIYIHTNRQEGSLLSTPSPAFIVCGCFDESHFDWCQVISHCSF